jgi:Ser/Thr protein kinase RdoA (MazF antagonist)
MNVADLGLGTPDQSDDTIRRDIHEHARTFLEHFPVLAPRVSDVLQHACRHLVSLQPCIRDVWHDHVLYLGDQVTGLIDFGSLRDDHFACDIARLLGSLVRDDQSGWLAGTTAYAQLCPLSAVDRQLITAYDESGVLLSSMNWIQWLYADHRTFDDANRVAQRCAEIAGRLQQLAGRAVG